jgi:hypothetical protein
MRGNDKMGEDQQRRAPSGVRKIRAIVQAHTGITVFSSLMNASHDRIDAVSFIV